MAGIAGALLTVALSWCLYTRFIRPLDARRAALTAGASTQITNNCI
jgi:peptidoglycan/LPS O-acetylase OafA/YrhL